MQNSLAYCLRSDGVRLLSEVIRVRGRLADLQVFEETRGLRVGDEVELRDEMFSVVLGPGLLGKIYDGLQNPLPELAEQVGYFLKPGAYIHGLSLTNSRGNSRRSSNRVTWSGRRHPGGGPGRHVHPPDHGPLRPGAASIPSKRSRLPDRTPSKQQIAVLAGRRRTPARR